MNFWTPDLAAGILQQQKQNTISNQINEKCFINKHTHAFKKIKKTVGTPLIIIIVHLHCGRAYYMTYSKSRSDVA